MLIVHKKKIGKKAQEEMVGFVLIVIIVAIVFLVFFGIFIREGNETKDNDSREIVQFLESFERYDTECAIGFEPDFSNMGELIQECFEGKICLNGKTSCEVLEINSKEILEKSFSIGELNYYKGYEFVSFYEEGNQTEEIIKIIKGNCNSSFIGGETFSSGDNGVFVSNLKICF